MKLPLPQSLTAQFALVVSCLAALVVVVGATTIYSLTASSYTIRQLAEERLALQEAAHDLAQHTLKIERMTFELSSNDTVDAVRETHRLIMDELTTFDRLVDRLASATTNDGIGAEALALHRSSQHFRTTVNIEAQLRETALGAQQMPASASAPQPRAALAGLDDDLRRQADALSAAARQQSEYFTHAYRESVQDLAEHSDRTRSWIIGDVAVSLLLAWLLAHVFFGRHVVTRLRRVSYALRHGDIDSPGGVAVHGSDELADMARAVEQFLEDRRRRKLAEDALRELNAELEARVAQRTVELSAALADLKAEIVERQHAEEAVRASEHFLDNIVENIPDTVFVKDAATLRFVRLNKAGEELLGYRREELIGKSVHDLFPPDEAEFFALKDRAVLQSRQMVDVPEEPVLTRHGRRWVHTMKIPIVDLRGEPQFLLGISRDITEQKRAEAELHESERRYREAQTALAHANRVTTLGQLAASISHEIKQPIAAVGANAQAGLLWLNGQPPNLMEARQAFERIFRDAKRASDVLNRIHGLVKNAPPSKESLRINEAIGEVVAITRGELVKNGVSVQLQLADGLPDVEGDRVELQQVILNLIINAVEAMADVDDGHRNVTIKTGKDIAGNIAVSVSDSGSGLAVDDTERLFEPFYTSKSGGLGMGLSICRTIVEAHGGRLWASPNMPRGAVFQFTVPAHRASELPMSASEPYTDV